jgi:hypothetical protein
VTMAVEQAIVFFVAFSYFLARFLRAQEAEAGQEGQSPG